MTKFPVFISVVFVVRNNAPFLEHALTKAVRYLSETVADFELIIIDNASTDESLPILEYVTSVNGLPNIQVYALTKEVDMDNACWVGVESALGDLVVVLDPSSDDIAFLSAMLDKALDGVDVVFATNLAKPSPGYLYRLATDIFNRIFAALNGSPLASEAPHYRLVSKKVTNFILQHRQPQLVYRHMPFTGGFSRVNLTYSSQVLVPPIKNLRESIDLGIRLLVSTTRVPMRVVTVLSLFGALANVAYCAYVVISTFHNQNVASGWISLSLQQSGMFFLISLVLWILGEYVINMAGLSNEAPSYHVRRELTSAHLTRKNRLNLEDVSVPLPTKADSELQ